MKEVRLNNGVMMPSVGLESIRLQKVKRSKRFFKHSKSVTA